MLQVLKKRKATNQVKFLREQKDISKKELAKRVEKLSQERFGKATPLAWHTIQAIEDYRYMPSFGLAQLVAEALGEELETVFLKLN